MGNLSDIDVICLFDWNLEIFFSVLVFLVENKWKNWKGEVSPNMPISYIPIRLDYGDYLSKLTTKQTFGCKHSKYLPVDINMPTEI